MEAVIVKLHFVIETLCSSQCIIISFILVTFPFFRYGPLHSDFLIHVNLSSLQSLLLSQALFGRRPFQKSILKIRRTTTISRYHLGLEHIRFFTCDRIRELAKRES